MAIEFLDDVKVEADLTVTPESGEGILSINSNSSYGNTRIKMSNPQGGEATVMSSYANPGANYFEIKYDNGATGSGEFRVKNTEIDCGFDSSATPITRVSSTGLRNCRRSSIIRYISRFKRRCGNCRTSVILYRYRN